MDLVTVYKAFTKKAAGMPASPEGGVFKPKPLPPPITAPGSQPLPTDANQSPAPAQTPMTPEESQSKGMQMLEKGWEKTMDTMKAMTAMNNGMAPQDAGLTQPATGAQPQDAPSIPLPPAGNPPPPTDGITFPLSKGASMDYGTIYNAMRKRAFFDGPDWQTWMVRKDALKPGAYKHLRAQDNGATTSFLTTALLGGGLGALADKLSDKDSSGVGGAIGGAAIGGGIALLANLIGKGAGYVTPTRSKEKHDKYQDSGTTAEWLIPGVANYNKVKTYGYALHGNEENAKS